MKASYSPPVEKTHHHEVNHECIAWDSRHIQRLGPHRRWQVVRIGRVENGRDQHISSRAIDAPYDTAWHSVGYESRRMVTEGGKSGGNGDEVRRWRFKPEVAAVAPGEAYGFNMQ